MRPSLSKKEEKTLYWIGLAIIILMVLFAIIIRLIHIPFPDCVFLTVTGLYCPGCGGTRAITELFRGHLLRSLYDHPLVLYTAVVAGWYMISHTIEYLSKGRIAIGMRYRDIYLYVALAIVAINWIVKDFFILTQGVYLLG